MTKKEMKKSIESALRDSTDLRDIIIRIHKPWVFVEFETQYDNGKYHKRYTSWGTAKICWPDKWSSEKGVNLAIDRAFAWTTKKIMEELHG